MPLAVTGKADPKAVAVACAVYDAVRPESVILFGSRARGDHRADSDIDLLVISDDHAFRDARMKARKAASDAARQIYGDYFCADLVWMPRDKYLECRSGINHVAAQAARDGVDMNGEKEEYQRDLSAPFDWPDAGQRVVNADRELIAMKVSRAVTYWTTASSGQAATSMSPAPRSRRQSTSCPKGLPQWTWVSGSQRTTRQR